ncbi:MAG: accessory gene regulator B family protein [Bacteroidales bacterium]|jgi:accessory gene regulator B|nr:accessory gene regulator B family protein [Bacteroidales bacterium]
MEHSIACSFADYLCKRKIIKPELHEVYVYGAELLFSSIITTALILLMGELFGEIIKSIVFIAVYTMVRRFTGGYHANTYLKCKVITASAFLASLFSSHLLTVHWWMYIILFILGNAVVFILAPIENPNKPIEDKDKVKLRRLSHLVFSVMTICGLLIEFLLQIEFGILFFSLLAVLVLMVIPKIMKGAKSNETGSFEKDGRHRS